MIFVRKTTFIFLILFLEMVYCMNIGSADESHTKIVDDSLIFAHTVSI